MLITNRRLDEKGKLCALECTIKNENRHTIEKFDATDILELVDNDYNSIINLLAQSNCHLITSQEASALDLYKVNNYGDHGKVITLTEAELNFCLGRGVNYDELLKIRATHEKIKDYEVRL